jgi:anti-sigma factor RsiW
MNKMGRTLGCAAAALAAIAAGGVPAAADAPIDTVFVAGRAGWVVTGIVAGQGDAYDIRADGQVITWLPPYGMSLSGPDGQSGVCTDNAGLGLECVVDGAPWGALVGRFGTGDPFVIGARQVIDGVGPLMLTVNDYDGYWFDNGGGFAVRVRASS